MSSQRLVHDARASTKGTIYQVYVVVQKCFEMISGQKVIIERYGDVTISDCQQVETKQYQGPLTDNHVNFWKTLKNWMQDGFDETLYASLILYTTQQFGEHAKIAAWNGEGIERRVEILREIHEEAEERQTHRQKNDPKHDQSIPASLSFQRLVLDPAKSGKLYSVVERFVIASRSPNMSTLYQRISDQYCKSILRGKEEDFLNALLGFVISPVSVSSDTWEISYEQFTAKVKDLTPQYCRETRVFPTKYLSTAVPLDAAATEPCCTQLFVQRIREIEYHDVIVQAVQEYLGAKRTILEEYHSYEVSESSHRDYAKEVLDMFRPRYRIASRNVSDVIKDSQTFFDQVTGEESPSFPGFDKPPRAFRNGLLHMHIDDPKQDLKWRLR